MNLLPHLKWLTSPDYTHVYYVDGKPRVFDAKIFTDDATHPGGWGTVLVVGMRLGGSAVTVDTAGNGLGSPNAADDKTLRSAYVMLDITDPEQPPTLMGEITNPGLGYTTSYPTVMAVADKSGTPNKWYLVFGTGPTALATVTSTQTARLLVYDLNLRLQRLCDQFRLYRHHQHTGCQQLHRRSGIRRLESELQGGCGLCRHIGGTAAAPTGNLYKLAVNKSTDSATWVEEQTAEHRSGHHRNTHFVHRQQAEPLGVYRHGPFLCER